MYYISAAQQVDAIKLNELKANPTAPTINIFALRCIKSHIILLVAAGTSYASAWANSASHNDIFDENTKNMSQISRSTYPYRWTEIEQGTTYHDNRDISGSESKPVKTPNEQ